MNLMAFLSKIMLLALPLTCVFTAYGKDSGQQQSSSGNSHALTMTLGVYEKGTGAPLRRAEVKYGEQRWYTDAKGLVPISIGGGSKGSLTISRKGYVSVTMPIRNLKGSKIYLEPGFDDDNLVVIQGQQRESTSKKSISAEEASRIAPGGDAAKVVRLMPGVQLGRGAAGRGPGGSRGAGAPAGGRGGPGSGGPRGPAPGGSGAPPAGAPPSGAPPAGAPSGGGPAGGPAGGSQPNGAPPAGGSPAGGPGGGGSGGGSLALVGSSGVIVRGSSPEDSKYYVDDIEVPYVFHSIDDLSVIPGSLIQQVDFESGGFGVQYGDASGGVIKLLTKNDIPERSTTELTVNFPYYAGMYDRRPVGTDGALSTSVRRSYVDYFAKKYYDSLQNTNNPAASNMTQTPYFVDGHVAYLKKLPGGYRKITLLTSEDGTLMVSSSRASNTSDISMTTKSATKFATLGVEQSSSLSRSWMYRTTPQISYTNIVSDSSFNSTKLDRYRVRVPTEFIRLLGPGENVYLGFDPQTTSETQAASSADPFAQTESSQNDKASFHGLAGWAAVDQKFGAFSATPGLRAFYNSQIKKNAYDPRVEMKYRAGSSNDIKSAVGQYSTSPSFIEADKERGRADLKFERTYHYILGLETRWNQAWTTEVQGFYKTGLDLITADAEKNFDNNGQSIASGAELFIRRNLTSRAFGWLTYTYSRTVSRDSKDEKYKRSPYDQTHVGNLIAGYRLTPTWDLTGRYRYNTGNTYTPSAGSTYDATNDRFTQLSTTNSNTKNLPASQSLSAYVTKDMLFDTWKLTARVGVESYWFGPQVTGMTSNYDYTKDQPQTSFNTIPFMELKGVL